MIYADIGLIPSKIIKENIKKIRLILKDINIYGNHEPHVTLYPNSFNSLDDVERVIKKVIKHHKPFYIEIIGIKQLKDPINNTIALIYEIKKTEKLIKLQKELFNELNKIRTRDQEKWFLRVIKQSSIEISEGILKNIKKYGYPFSPENWIFHITIASFMREIDLSSLKWYDIKTKFVINEIGIFLEDDEVLKLYKRIKLNN